MHLLSFISIATGSDFSVSLHHSGNIDTSITSFPWL